MRKNTLVALFGFMAGVALFLLWKENQAHVLDVLPWALLLLCPILHLFMHRGHGGHGGQESHGIRGASHGSHRMDQGEGEE